MTVAYVLKPDWGVHFHYFVAHIEDNSKSVISIWILGNATYTYGILPGILLQLIAPFSDVFVLGFQDFYFFIFFFQFINQGINVDLSVCFATGVYHGSVSCVHNLNDTPLHVELFHMP